MSYAYTYDTIHGILARDALSREHLVEHGLIDYKVVSSGSSPQKTFRAYFLYEDMSQKCFDGRTWSTV